METARRVAASAGGRASAVPPKPQPSRDARPLAVAVHGVRLFWRDRDGQDGSGQISRNHGTCGSPSVAVVVGEASQFQQPPRRSRHVRTRPRLQTGQDAGQPRPLPPDRPQLRGFCLTPREPHPRPRAVLAVVARSGKREAGRGVRRLTPPCPGPQRDRACGLRMERLHRRGRAARGVRGRRALRRRRADGAPDCAGGLRPPTPDQLIGVRASRCRHCARRAGGVRYGCTRQP